MITEIHIENFKSLHNFTLSRMGNFVCIIGLNGAGKTSFLQALNFVGILAAGSTCFRGWRKSDILTLGSGTKTCSFRFVFDFDGKTAMWSGRFNINKQRLVEEHFRDSVDGADILALKDGKLTWRSDFNNASQYPSDVSVMTYEGSIVSVFDFGDTVVSKIKKELLGFESLELVTPDKLRKAWQETDRLGLGGEGLAGFLSSLNSSDAADLDARMSDIYPEVKKYDIKRQRFGWKKLLLHENAHQGTVSVDHINDGYLRVLAMISQRYANSGTVLLDEIENGINQEVVEKLVSNFLNYNRRQVIVTTHSPLILNYLPDDEARKSVFLFMKDAKGHTSAVNFFELDQTKDKLGLLGPGEVMSDTDLKVLNPKVSSN